MDDSQLRVFFTEERAMRLILESRADRRMVDRVGFASCKSADLFGWTTLHRFVGQELYFSFKKVFRHTTATAMMSRNWANELRFATYRSSSEAATQKFYVSDAHVHHVYACEVPGIVANGEQEKTDLGMCDGELN